MYHSLHLRHSKHAFYARGNDRLHLLRDSLRSYRKFHGGRNASNHAAGCAEFQPAKLALFLLIRSNVKFSTGVAPRLNESRIAR